MSRIRQFLLLCLPALLLLPAAGVAQAQPTVTVTAPDTQASEAGDTATFLFARVGGDNSQALTVNFTFDETTTAIGADYSTGAEVPFFTCCAEVSIPAGESELTVTVTAVPDNVTEPEERIDITLAAGSYVIGASSSAGVSILDDPPIVTVVATTPVAVESGAPGAFTFSRTGGNIDTALRVEFSFDPTTTAGQPDYSNPGFPFFICCTEITIPAGAASAEVTVMATPDNLAEGDEYIDITIVEDVYQVGDPASARVTIVDDPPIVTVTASMPQAFENGEDGIFTFTRTGGNLAASLTVFFDFDPTTTAGQPDYSTGNFPFFICCTQITIPAGSATAEVPIEATPDNLAEGDEYIDITLASGDYQIGDPDGARVTIIDDAPVVTLTASTPQAFENGEAATFTFTRTGGNLNAAMTVFFDFDPTTTAGQPDYSTDGFPFFICCTQISIPAGFASADVNVTATPDNLAEGDEFIDITLAEDAYQVGDPSSARVTIIDDAPVVTLTAPDSEASERGDTAYFRFDRDGGNIDAALDINFTFEKGTTAGTSDYSVGPFPFFTCCRLLTIPAGASFAEVVIFPTADNLEEPEEVIDIKLADGNYLVGDPDQASVFIENDDTIFKDNFELVVDTKRCRAYLQEEINAARMDDWGPSVFDPVGEVEYLKCGPGSSYNSRNQDCVAMPVEISEADSVAQLNNGIWGDNLGYSDWLAGSKAIAQGCVFRGN